MTMDTDKVDLTALDPTADAGHWESVVASTLAGVDRVLDARREAENDALSLIARWRRPLLAAAAVVLVTLIPAEFLLEARESRAEAVRRLATVSVTWIESNQEPTGAEILRTIAEGSRP
jgi:hypothetical protein